MRAVAQAISYEIVMALFLIIAMVLVSRYRFGGIVLQSWWLCFLIPFLLLMWFVVILAETNRAPFDFVEGESELVSGFNVEYGGSGFAFIFMAEYSRILIICLISRCLFFGLGIYRPIGGLILVTCVVWVRAVIPRMRYDCLIALTWKRYLPVALGLLVLVVPGILVWRFMGVS